MLLRVTKSLLAKASEIARPLRLLGLAGLLLPATLPLPSHAASLPPRVEQALKASKLSSDALSVALIPLDGPGTPSYLNADRPVNPASTMKLVTTYAALELLGPTHQWKTAFYTDGPLRNGVLQGNLYLKGGGDPKLTMERLWLLLRDLRHAGVQQVQGDLVLERNHFRTDGQTPFDDDGGDRTKPYLVEPDALMVNLKTLRLIVRGEARGAAVQAEPPIPYIRIDNRVKVTAPATCPGWPQVTYNFQPQADGSLEVIAAGQIPEGCSGQRYLSLLDHPAFTGGTVRALWSELGGSISGQDRLGATPGNARLLAQAWSPDVVEIIRDINKYSNNTMARQLFLSIGARHRLPGDANDAAAAYRAIDQWLTRKGIRAPNLVLENGSGLSRRERISAREMAAMLHAAWKSPYAAEFISSMPLAAMDGTLRKRMRNTPLAGNAHLKTGTLNNVRALAGYSRDAQGHTWAAVVILNHPRPWGASAILDQVLQELYRQPGSLSAGLAR
ncbi:D-alanyl-D-alanine carboxypeptidase [Pseudomonas sp. OF001]|jgi:D-alanyl-D-alanine carboxypeptidase/D-alanyl-D-alanine-endopeptidase (penicillin-binding protein 4)|uniref:D-alanyl-D-alanine carboxypeptidase/D-alanyl-D-alanine endopeptidase n=1 Tax=Pseudomonas sp. OF001 TaxID=2772300 RepID=UPI00191ABA96|nr:D-alanyl-D-alanine carboxypeptidase/D-alanyl-D-alanine-endopeptidase [Pseudomonas sp. OF001]CAD5376456.1 D-alanyl-D-alanine carboxypeptidase [Pseudomonas sp. OF001]